MQRYPENIAVLTLGILIAGVGVLPALSGGIFRNGAPVVVAVFLLSKGTGTLRCRTSDVLLSSIALVLVLFSKIVPAHIMSPVVFHVAALAILPIFAMTGLTFKTIALERRKKKESGGQ
jgi:FtsH-binding integral membrane protein